ncbi:MAG: tape measure protein [Betaproteobacteria bacterium]|nr:tape measure protein [Betaproteobacteria bacterium]
MADFGIRFRVSGAKEVIEAASGGKKALREMGNAARDAGGKVESALEASSSGAAQDVIRTQKEIKSGLEEVSGKLSAVRKNDPFPGVSMTSANLVRSLMRVSGALAALSVGRVFVSLYSGLLETDIAAQRLSASLAALSGGVTNAGQAQEYLSRTTNRIGLEYVSASASFVKLTQAAEQNNVAASTTRALFEGIGKAAGAMRLSAEESSGVMGVLAQMMGESTVKAEHLRAVEERLPGAFELAARAMGMTRAELSRALSEGQVFTDDFLPKFERAMNEKFSGPSKNAQTELNRLSNSWTEFKSEVAKGTGTASFEWLTRGLNESRAAMQALNGEILNSENLLVRATARFGRLFAAARAFEAGALGFNQFDTVEVQQKAMARLSDVNKKIREAEKREDTGEVQRLSKERQRLRDEINDLAVTRGKETGFIRPDLEGDAEKQRAKDKSFLDKQLKDLEDYTARFDPLIAKKKALEEYEQKFGGLKVFDPERYEKGRAALVKQLEASDVSKAAEIFHAQGDARIAEAENTAKRVKEVLQEQQKSYAIGTKEFLEATAAEDEKLIRTKIAVLEERLKTAKPAEKITLKTQLDELYAQLADIPRKVAVANAEAQKSSDAALRQLQIAGGKALDPLAEAELKFQQQFGETLAKAKADGNEALIEAGKTAWAAIADEVQFQKAKQKFDALFSDLNAQIEALRAAAKDAGILDGLVNDAQVQELKNRALPAIRSVASEMKKFSGISPVNEKTAKEASAQIEKITREVSPALEKFNDDLRRGLTDSLYRAFEDGKGGGKAFVDSVRNMLKTAAFKVVVEATVNPVLGMVSGGFASLLGGGEPGAAAGVGGLGGALNLLSAGNSVFSAASGGGLYGAFATSSIGQSLGLSTALQGATQTGAALAPAMTGLGAAIPWVGAIGALAALLGGLFDDQENPRFTPVYGDMAGGIPGLTKEGYLGQIGFSVADSKDFAKSVLALGVNIDRIGASLLEYDPGAIARTRERLTGVTRAADGQPLESSQPELDEKQARVLATEMARQVLSMALDDIGEGLGDVMRFMDGEDSSNFEGVLAFADAVKQGRLLFGQIGQSVSGMSGALVEAMGGVQGFTASMQAMGALLVSDTDRTASQLADARAEVDSAFGKYGVSAPKTVEEFRNLAGALDLNTEFGREAFAALSDVASAFQLQIQLANQLSSAYAEARKNYTAAAGQDAAVRWDALSMAREADFGAQGKLARAFEVPLPELERVVGELGGLASAAGACWELMSDAQRVAAIEAMNARAAYIGAVKEEFDAQLELVKKYEALVARAKGFAKSLDADMAQVRIDAGLLDKGDYLNAEIGRQRAALAALEAARGETGQLLDAAEELRRLTMERYSFEIQSLQAMKQFAVDIGDYLKSLKVGGKSPLTTGEKLLEAGRQFNDLLLALESGTEEEKDRARRKLTSSADTYLELARLYSPSQYPERFDEIYKALEPYADLGSIDEQQLAAQQAIQRYAQETVDELQGLKGMGATWQATESAKMDAALSALLPLAGILNSLGAGGAIANAISGLPAEIAALILGASAPGGNASGGARIADGMIYFGGEMGGSSISLPDAYQWGMDQGAAGNLRAIYDAAKAGGMTLKQVDQVYKLTPGTAEDWARSMGLPVFAQGIDRLPEDMLVMAHEGERIFPAADNRRLFEILEGGQAPGGGVERVLQSILRELAELRQQNAELTMMLARVQERAASDSAGRIVEACRERASRLRARVAEGMPA